MARSFASQISYDGVILGRGDLLLLPPIGSEYSKRGLEHAAQQVFQRSKQRSGGPKAIGALPPSPKSPPPPPPPPSSPTPTRLPTPSHSPKDPQKTTNPLEQKGHGPRISPALKYGLLKEPPSAANDFAKPDTHILLIPYSAFYPPSWRFHFFARFLSPPFSLSS